MKNPISVQRIYTRVTLLAVIVFATAVFVSAQSTAKDKEDIYSKKDIVGIMKRVYDWQIANPVQINERSNNLWARRNPCSVGQVFVASEIQVESKHRPSREAGGESNSPWRRPCRAWGTRGEMRPSHEVCDRCISREYCLSIWVTNRLSPAPQAPMILDGNPRLGKAVAWGYHSVRPLRG